MDVTILTERELRDCVALDGAAVDIVEQAFAALGRGGVVMPPIMRLDIPEHNGDVDAKTAYVPGLDSFAVKISPGFFDNPKLGLPSVTGMMVLFSARTGLVEAVLLDNGYLTDLRTAAAGAVAARHLAPGRCATVGVIGAGGQARLQIEALALVRAFERVLVWARDGGKAASYATEMGARLGVAVEAAATPEAVVRESAVVVTTTPSTVPLIEAAWLHPGLHITAMGSDAQHKNELAPGVLAGADRLVCDRRAQSIVLGEMHHAIDAGTIAADAPVTELGEIAAGAKAGRADDGQITVCDLTGTGVQDTAIAIHAHRVAAGRGYGAVIAN